MMFYLGSATVSSRSSSAPSTKNGPKASQVLRPQRNMIIMYQIVVSQTESFRAFKVSQTTREHGHATRELGNFCARCRQKPGGQIANSARARLYPYSMNPSCRNSVWEQT